MKATIQNFFDTARWAESLLKEEKENCNKFTGFARQQAVKNYYYLSEWLETFNRLTACLNWNEEHVIYQDGIIKLSNHCNNL